MGSRAAFPTALAPRPVYLRLRTTCCNDKVGRVGPFADDAVFPRRWQLSPEAADPGVRRRWWPMSSEPVGRESSVRPMSLPLPKGPRHLAAGAAGVRAEAAEGRRKLPGFLFVSPAGSAWGNGRRRTFWMTAPQAATPGHRFCPNG
jgi:hypothetical protein